MNNTAENQAGTGAFAPFGLHESIHRGVVAAGFDAPRPIQVEALPAGLEGRDVLGLAQTGTGKTAAFALPILQRMVTDRRKGPRALVLAPTRELANQIAEEFRVLARYTRVDVMTIYGGVSQVHQVNKLRQRPEIVVGCPGRVLDLGRQGELDVDDVEVLVLDEADHMFDMGFLPDIRRIIRALPSKRQNLLFSATMPSEIRHLADEVLHDPHVVELADAAPAETIDHALIRVHERRKRALLDELLQQPDCHSAIIFTRTKYRAKRLAQQLERAGHKAVALQGNMSQRQRDRAMAGFRARDFDILVATDIAARGIDVSNVGYVINFDVPQTPEAYTHRIGRTGRAEQEGVAYTFVTAADGAWLRATERMIGARIEERAVEGFDALHVDEDDAARSADLRRSDQRPPQARRGSRPGRQQGGRRSQGGGGRSEGGGGGRSRSGGGGRRRRR